MNEAERSRCLAPWLLNISNVLDSILDVAAVATPGDGPQGPFCASLPVEGEGSFTGMADDTAAVAASSNPEVSSLLISS